MWLELKRRILMIMLIVAFAAGLAMPAAHAESHHQPGSMITMVSASMDHAGSCNHNGCPISHQADMSGICLASGSAPGALLPATVVFDIAAVHAVLAPSLDRAMTGRAIPPDPHPPKQI